MGVCASCHEPSGTFVPPDLGFPADGLDHFGLCFKSSLQMATDLGRGARGPGPFNQDTSSRGVARFGHRPLPALRAGGRFCGDQAQALPQCSWALATGQVAPFCHQGHGPGTLHPTEGVKGLAHWLHTPRFHVRMECLIEALEAFGMCSHGADVFLQDDLLRQRGTDDLRAPSEGGRTPMGSATVPDSLSEQAGCETARGVFAIPDGSFTRSGESANGFLFDLGDRHGGELP
jgi:hypothetical protein